MDKETIMQLLADGVISNEVAERYFPELKENEDEKVKKELIKAINLAYDCGIAITKENRDKYLAWIERQGEQKLCMIQWKGDNLKEVLDFTGKDKNFDKWFKSFEEYEKYVSEHNNIFKLFNSDGSHFEVPIGAWIVKTPDGYNVASKAVFKQKPAWSEDDEIRYKTTLDDLEDEIWTQRIMHSKYKMIEGRED